MLNNKRGQRGLALAELLVGVFVFATLATAVAGLATLGTRTAVVNEQRTVAQAIANEETERIRLMAYADVGFTEPEPCGEAQCDPDGSLQYSKQVERNRGQVYVVSVSIKLVDDPLNGPAAGPPLTEESADYKEVSIKVALPSLTNAQQSVQESVIALPAGGECVSNAECQGIPGQSAWVCCGGSCQIPVDGDYCPKGWIVAPDRCGCLPPPTIPPSVSPTADPSAPPTDQPTNLPTDLPTASPTVTPTITPTVTPTVNPTTGPGASPTASPAASPAGSPTASPAVSPTASPASSPTASPDVSPSASPQVSPTASPAVSPAASPTASPNTSPVASPVPSTSPSSSPPPPECVDDLDCPDQACVSGECVPYDCTDNGDCLPGQSCVSGECQSNDPLAPPDSCNTDTDCGTGYHCLYGSCVADEGGIDGDGQCPPPTVFPCVGGIALSWIWQPVWGSNICSLSVVVASCGGGSDGGGGGGGGGGDGDSSHVYCDTNGDGRTNCASGLELDPTTCVPPSSNLTYGACGVFGENGCGFEQACVEDVCVANAIPACAFCPGSNPNDQSLCCAGRVASVNDSQCSSPQASCTLSSGATGVCATRTYPNSDCHYYECAPDECADLSLNQNGCTDVDQACVTTTTGAAGTCVQGQQRLGSSGEMCDYYYCEADPTPTPTPTEEASPTPTTSQSTAPSATPCQGTNTGGCTAAGQSCVYFGGEPATCYDAVDGQGCQYVACQTSAPVPTATPTVASEPTYSSSAQPTAGVQGSMDGNSSGWWNVWGWLNW